MKSFLVLGLLLATSSYGAAEKTFSFAIPGYPRGAENCEMTSKELGKQFEKLTQTKVIETKCTYEKAKSFDIELRYVASGPLELVASEPWPIYPSLAECQSGLPAEVAATTEITGLSPFFQYCSYYSETSTFERTIHRYTPRMVTLGGAKAAIRSLSFPMFEGLSAGSEKQVVEEMLKKSNEIGLPARQAFLDYRTYGSDLWLRFVLPLKKAKLDLRRRYLLKTAIAHWSSQPIFESATPLLTESKAQCLLQREEAMKAFESAFSGPTVWFCMWDSSLWRARLYHLRIDPGPESFQEIIPGDDGEPFPSRYPTKESCEIEKSRVITHYRKLFGQERVVGALCSWPWKAKPHLPIKMFVYTKSKNTLENVLSK